MRSNFTQLLLDVGKHPRVKMWKDSKIDVSSVIKMFSNFCANGISVQSNKLVFHGLKMSQKFSSIQGLIFKIFSTAS